jgi:hypothetical protein
VHAGIGGGLARIGFGARFLFSLTASARSNEARGRQHHDRMCEFVHECTSCFSAHHL